MTYRNYFRSFTGLVLAAVLFFSGLKMIDWIHQSTTLQLNDVVVVGNRLLKTDEVIKLIPIPKGRNLTKIDLQEIQQSVENQIEVMKCVYKNLSLHKIFV